MLTMEYQIRNSLNSVDSFKKYSRVFFFGLVFFLSAVCFFWLNKVNQYVQMSSILGNML